MAEEMRTKYFNIHFINGNMIRVNAYGFRYTDVPNSSYKQIVFTNESNNTISIGKTIFVHAIAMIEEIEEVSI